MQSPDGPSRHGRSRALPAVLPAVAAVAACSALLPACRPEAPAPRPTPVQERTAAWSADPALPAGTPDELVARGAALLAADLPERAAAARDAFRAALVRDPQRLDALAGHATALADLTADEPDGAALQEAHALLDWGLSRTPGRSDLLAARARLLLLAPSDRNRAEALTAARQARAAAPGDAGAALAYGLALLAADPAAAAAALDRPDAAPPEDRRLLSAAARARWAAGDPAAALRLAGARLEQDPGHAAMLELAAEIEAASARPLAAAARLDRWRALDPAAARPAWLRARLAAQLDGDLPTARRLLVEALPRAGSDFLAARILALQAAVALAMGDELAAQRAVEEALARVPASAPARYQAAVLAFRRGDRRALREAAGVVGQRCGPDAARLLAARQAELGSASLDDAAGAWRAWAAGAPRDPSVALAAGGALARMGLTGDALALGVAAARRDPLEGRLRRRVVECWEAPVALAEASTRFQAIAEAEPDAAVAALQAAGACELLLGRTVAAESLARRALSRDPRAAAARLALAQVALDRGQPALAARHAAEAADLRHAEAAPALLARALEASGRLQAAEQAVAPAAAAERDGAAARLGHARLLLALGRADEARREAAAILAGDPEVGPARGLLLDAGEAAARAAR